MSSAHSPLHLQAGGRSIIISGGDGMPEILAFTAALGDSEDVGRFAQDAAALADTSAFPVPEGGSDELAPIAIVPEAAAALLGQPGLEGHRPDGSAWSPRFVRTESAATPSTASVVCVDEVAGLRVAIGLALDEFGVLSLDVNVTNLGSTDYALSALRPTLRLPGTHRELLCFSGRWSDEFDPERHEWQSGTVEVSNRRGRTSPDRMATTFSGTPGFGEQHGEVIGVHVAWSGNTEIRYDTLSDGRRLLQAGELLLSGEIVLAPGETYAAPTLLCAQSDEGLNGISDAFHGHFRARTQHPTTARPIHLNTWEAVYFDHDLDTLKGLADRAAQVGIERWILDDGWFHARRHDRAGLGDWWIDPDVWPDGLDPIIEHVTGLGMEFGLWFEPEMVNPDSDLYRNHPEWVLTDPNYDPVLARHQLVLDLTNPEVSEYLFEKIDAILAAHDIAYVKWDMNRDLVHPASSVHPTSGVSAASNGRATVHHQMLALYALLDRLTTAHPTVEFESCSSGGARIDARILELTKRFWTSDCNDALDRQRIQRGFSYLFPPELMGAHIGPPTSHTTGRTHTLGFRAATAFFGHLGVEWNLLDCDDAELEQVRQIIELHKQFRPLLHAGRVMRFDHPDPAVVAHGVVAHDGNESLVSLAQVATSRTLPVAPLRWAGLAEGQFRVELVPLPGLVLGKAKRQPGWITDGIEVSGAALAQVGLQPPILHPESAILIHAKHL